MNTQKTNSNYQFSKNNISGFSSFSLGYLMNNGISKEELIAPGILLQGELITLTEIIKTDNDFLLRLLTHLAAGKELLAFKPTRPLNIYYLQAETGYDYMREKLQAMDLDDDIINIAGKRLHICNEAHLIFGDKTIGALAAGINSSFAKYNQKPDIIVINPLPKYLSSKKLRAVKNHNAPLHLLERARKLQQLVDKQVGVILVH